MKGRANERGSRTLSPRNRRYRSGTALRQSRCRRAMPGAVGLVCGASDSHERLNRYAGETIEAVGTFGTASRSRNARQGCRASAGPSDCGTDHSDTAWASWFLSDWQRELGGGDSPRIRNNQPGTAPPHGGASGGVQREVAIALSAVTQRKTPPGGSPAAQCERQPCESGFHGVAPLSVLALGGGDAQAHLLAKRTAGARCPGAGGKTGMRSSGAKVSCPECGHRDGWRAVLRPEVLAAKGPRRDWTARRPTTEASPRRNGARICPRCGSANQRNRIGGRKNR